MPATNLTFAVQVGSRGHEIAQHVSRKLGFRYYDWEVTSQAAREAGVSPETLAAASEQGSGGLKRTLEKLFAAGAFVHDDTTMEGPNAATMEAAIRTLTQEDYRSFIERVVLDLSRRGNAVIVGHSSQIVLRDEPAVLKILVCGSPAARIDRLVKDEGLEPDRAIASVQSSDKARKDFFRQVYRVDLLAASLYDLCLNTDQLSTSDCVEIVLTAARAMTPEAPAASTSAPESSQS